MNQLDPIDVDNRFEKLIKQFGFESTMKVARMQDRGRFVIANRDIKKDELIFQENPYAHVVNPIRNKFVCDFCSDYSKQDLNKQLKITCDNCQDVYYCNDQCKQHAFEKWHKYECNAFKFLSTEGMDQSPSKKKSFSLIGAEKLLVRTLLISSILESNSNSNAQESPVELIQFPYNFSDIWSLYGEKDSLKPKNQLLKVISNKTFEAFKKCEFEKPLKLDVDHIWTLAAKGECNVYGLYYPMSEQNKLQISDEDDFLYAFGFYVVASLFNHSCSPNVYKFRKGQTYEFRALYDIPKGTELCHNYLYLATFNDNQRQQQLINNYGFLCKCDACVDSNFKEKFLQNYVCPSLGCGGLLVSESRVRETTSKSSKKKKKKEMNNEEESDNGKQICLKCREIVE